MYRLLNLKKTTLQNVGHLSNNDTNQKICSLCQKLHKFTFVSRTQSTQSKPKKVRKRFLQTKKTFAELLVVTNKSTSQQKAPVKKLSPTDFKMFATTDLKLNEFYKLKALKKSNYVKNYTYNNLTVVENIPMISEVDFGPKDTETSDTIESTPQPILDVQTSLNFDTISENEILESIESELPIDTFRPAVLDDEPIEVINPKEFDKDETANPYLEKTALEEIASRTLSAYIEICSYLRMPQRGLNAFLFHKSRIKKFPKTFPPIKGVKVYNGLLKAFAVKGDYPKIQDVLGYAKEEDIKLNEHSYAAIFECLGRINIDNNHLKQIRIHTKDALAAGITFDKIMNKVSFSEEQRNIVLKAFHSYDPNYVINFVPPPLQYNNNLVNNLNHYSQLEQPKPLEKHNKGLFNGNMMAKLIKDQIELEKQGYVTINSIETKSDISNETMSYRKIFNEHLNLWEKAALEGFNRDLMMLSVRRNILNLEPYLRSLPVKDFVQLILDEAKRITEGSETFSPSCSILQKQLGLRVYAHYKVLRKQKLGVLDKIIKVHNNYCNYYANTYCQPNSTSTTNYLNTRQYWQWTDHLLKGQGATITMDHQIWVPSVMQNIGKFLYHIILHDLKINVNSMNINSKHKNYLPAFYTIFRTQGVIVKEEVKPHPVLSKLYRASIPETLTFPINEVPMRCPPVPWNKISIGGYLVAHCDLVRLPFHAVTQRQRLREARTNIYPAIDSLNQLSAIPWRINTKILDIVLEIFSSGGCSDLDIPEPPSSLAPITPLVVKADKMQRFLHFRQRLLHKRAKADMYSLWCDCLYRLSLANHFRDDIFWLPHNMDFRGRVYPIPPHLNHLGSDLARSLLVFAEARPLGANGLDWLKLHLVNLTGLKKQSSLDDRLIFANTVMDKILDSADYPLTGKKWWAQSEEPWQTLACCIEITKAHRSPDPEKHESYFPVHQDGSCNGLQHYAALGRDSAGAHSVNLTASSVPQDVYTAVVKLVEQQRIKDAENGIEVAKILNGFVKRKVIKQTIMTTVYGVTRYGARLQIARQLKDISDFPKEHVWLASSYLTARTFDSLRSMFTSTREIQDWFTECARLIASAKGQNVEWVTPLGLPIVQPYNKFKPAISKVVYENFAMDKYEKPNVLKQKNAFPPNFIHSLDSSHMMLTSLNCERAGVTFVSVHDCFWTHPSTVPIMNRICREQFVSLHSEPILEDVMIYFSKKFGHNEEKFSGNETTPDLVQQKLNKVILSLPRTGKFDIKEVLRSVYFFS